MAATLAAIRAQGEFAQLELRYRGMLESLRELQREFTATLDEARHVQIPLMSERLAVYTSTATAWMLEEVSHWRGLLETNEMERG